MHPWVLELIVIWLRNYRQACSNLHCRTNHDETQIDLDWKYPISDSIKLQFTGDWLYGQCTHSRSEWSGFEPWPGTLCCVLGQDTQLSQCLSPPRSVNGYRQIVGGNPKKLRASDLQWTSILSRGVEILLSASCYRNWDKLWKLSATLGPKTSYFTRWLNFCQQRQLFLTAAAGNFNSCCFRGIDSVRVKFKYEKSMWKTTCTPHSCEVLPEVMKSKWNQNEVISSVI